MNGTEWNEFAMAPPSVVHTAARDFAKALSETPQFKAFEQAYELLSADEAARQAEARYQAKANSLRALLMLNAVGADERAELERLWNDYVSLPTVEAYIAAEADLTALCQQLAAMISGAIGLDYAATCGASCCG